MFLIPLIIDMKKGFTLIEVIIYSALVVIILGVLTNAILVVSNSYRRMATYRDIENGAMLAMNRMSREIKSASDINGSQTVYDNANGSLMLNLGSTATTSRFYVSGGSIILDENGVQTGSLTPSSVTVSSLIFRHIVSTSSEAVKIEVIIQGEGQNSSISKNFYNTIVLRGSY